MRASPPKNNLPHKIIHATALPTKRNNSLLSLDTLDNTESNKELIGSPEIEITPALAAGHKADKKQHSLETIAPIGCGP